MTTPENVFKQLERLSELSTFEIYGIFSPKNKPENQSQYLKELNECANDYTHEGINDTIYSHL